LNKLDLGCFSSSGLEMFAERGCKRDYSGRKGLLRECFLGTFAQKSIFQDENAEGKSAASIKVNSVALQT
jgi:hypothetical protein